MFVIRIGGFLWAWRSSPSASISQNRSKNSPLKEAAHFTSQPLRIHQTKLERFCSFLKKGEQQESSSLSDSEAELLRSCLLLMNARWDLPTVPPHHSQDGPDSAGSSEFQREQVFLSALSSYPVKLVIYTSQQSLVGGLGSSEAFPEL